MRAHTHRKNPVKTQREDAGQGERHHQKPTLLAPGSQTSSLQNCEEKQTTTQTTSKKGT